MFLSIWMILCTSVRSGLNKLHTETPGACHFALFLKKKWPEGWQILPESSVNQVFVRFDKPPPFLEEKVQFLFCFWLTYHRNLWEPTESDKHTVDLTQIQVPFMKNKKVCQASHREQASKQYSSIDFASVSASWLMPWSPALASPSWKPIPWTWKTKSTLVSSLSSAHCLLADSDFTC